MAYGSDSDFQAWLDANGLTLPAGANLATLRSVGSSYVDAAYGAKLACSSRTGGWEQELEFPRTGHYVNGQLLPSDLIPPAWINASYRAAYLESTNPGWATGSTDPNRLTKRERVDTIEREFFGKGEVSGSVTGFGGSIDALIDGMLAPWLCSGVRRFDSLFRVV